ncbi:MAG: pre-peptidase C-terminal domain-containing protein, partial [Myxococcales bacterium]|nr:pre-peptidase C-terminal domain-containing protein [Myxococcales bacterium]
MFPSRKPLRASRLAVPNVGFILRFALGVLCIACGEPTEKVGDGGADGGEGGVVLPPGAIPCQEDADCADNIECTKHQCNDLGYCVITADVSVCDDGIYCNGVEQCDPEKGCVISTVDACSDGDICTLDECDEAEKKCIYSPRDQDGDGEADWHCDNGTDCDDFDPRRAGTFPEICGDFVDNDCDDITDESMCSRPAHDGCSDPLDVSAGGAFLINNTGALPDYLPSCGTSKVSDLVLELTLTEPKDVLVMASGKGITTVMMRTTCDSAATEFECSRSVPGEVRARALAAGTYSLIVGSSVVGEINVNVVLSEPTSPPMNEGCAAPLDVGAGGTFSGQLVDVADDVSVSCRTAADSDLVYAVTLAEESDLEVVATSPLGSTMTVAVRTTCADEETDLRCVRGAPASSRLHRLPAGTYYVIVEGSTSRELDFTLAVNVLPPTDPPAADTCAVAVPIALGSTVMGTLANKQDDLSLSCGLSYPDAVYSFELSEPRDVRVEIDGGGAFMYQAIQSTCGDEESELRCTKDNDPRLRVRNLSAGTYFVAVESLSGGSYEVSVEADPPSVSTPAAGNSSCATATVVPETGGLYNGSTAGGTGVLTSSICPAATGPEAFFRLDLSQTRTVTASSEGSSFDTVLYLLPAAC